ncbi:hypothetical protein KI688_005907 [Linnemannia hyalina]|uniref:Uncharacterized protein n=1 Tax=Linnemannia hyalina TaxID=64524 RepID=A0A9P8BWL4_9FUNG|nr:hypothetical protein KI688_005907 [Linnemannia hyalina]
MATSRTMELKAKYDFVKFLLHDIIITITCYGDGEGFPQILEVELMDFDSLPRYAVLSHYLLWDLDTFKY